VSGLQRELAVVESTIDEIEPMLEGLGPELQGAILADLTSTWLSGFHGVDTADSMKIRREMLDTHMGFVWQMVERLR
jgi:hypothetical protein